MNGVKVFLLSIAAVAVLAVGSVVMWQVGWLFNNANNNRTANMIQNGDNYQSALRTQLGKGIDNVAIDTTEILKAQAAGQGAYADQLKAQREADAGTVCQQASQINHFVNVVPAAMVKWVNGNCQFGSVSPKSVYYYVGGQG